MTAQEFYDWKKSLVTQQVFSQLSARVSALKDEIVADARNGNSYEQAFKAGAIYAYTDVVQTEFEESNGD